MEADLFCYTIVRTSDYGMICRSSVNAEHTAVAMAVHLFWNVSGVIHWNLKYVMLIQL